MSGVRFTRESAKRIADVVRTVELGDRDATGLRFGSAVGDAGRKTFRIATFTGAWAINSTKTVTFKYVTNTPNTASVLNLFFPWPGLDGTADCAIARDGTSWYLVDVPMETVSLIVAGATVAQTFVSNISVLAELNTNNCTINVSTSIVTGAITINAVSSTYSVTSLRMPTQVV